MKKNIINISLTVHSTISDGYLLHSNFPPKRAIDFKHSLHFSVGIHWIGLILQYYKSYL